MSRLDRLGAVPTRVRQEIEKRARARLERAGWRASPPNDAALGMRGGPVAPPWVTRVVQDRPAPSDADLLIAEADDVVAGRFEVFGKRLPAFEATRDWQSEPATGVETGRGPWYQVSVDIAGSDLKVFWEHNRHHALLRLAQASHLTGERRYGAALRSLLDGWIEQDAPGSGLNWASSLEVAFRASTWCWLWALTRTTDLWDEAFTRRFLQSLWSHADHVDRFDSSHHSPNTHLTGEALGLLYVGATFPGMRRAARWRRRGRDILLREIDRQILPDGMHFERSTCYHHYTLEFYLHFLFLTADGEPELAERLRGVVTRLLGASRALQLPSGAWPVLGDGDGGCFLRLGSQSPVDASGLLGAAAAWVGEVPHVGEGDSEAWWLPPGAPDRSEPPAVAASLPDAGYWRGSSGSGADERWSVLVDTGKLGVLGGGHGHADLGHMELSYGDRSIVTDPGCGVYAADPALRDWFRSEAAHARPVLPAFPLALPGDTFAWRSTYEAAEVRQERREGLWHLALRYGLGADGALTHTRQVIVQGAGVLVLDWLEGAAASGSLRWPLAGEASVDGEGVVTTTTGVCLEVFALGDLSVEPTRLASGMGSLSYGHVERRPFVEVPFSGQGRGGLLTAFARSSLVTGVTVDEEGSAVVIGLDGAEQSGDLTIAMSWERTPDAVWSETQRAGGLD